MESGLLVSVYNTLTFYSVKGLETVQLTLSMETTTHSELYSHKYPNFEDSCIWTLRNTPQSWWSKTGSCMGIKDETA